MSKFTDAMLDLETLGIQHDAVIASVGIVFFNKGEDVTSEILLSNERTFTATFNLAHQQNVGRKIDADTVRWWIGQSAMAKTGGATFANVGGNQPNYNRDILVKVSDALKDVKRLWGNGAGFDNELLRSLFKSYGIPFPLKYWTDCCYRTIKNIAGKDVLPFPKDLTKHIAIHDAAYQVLNLQHLLKD